MIEIEDYFRPESGIDSEKRNTERKVKMKKKTKKGAKMMEMKEAGKMKKKDKEGLEKKGEGKKKEDREKRRENREENISSRMMNWSDKVKIVRRCPHVYAEQERVHSMY